MAGRIYAMGLIFTSLLVLSLPGILYNNFTSSGLAPAFALACAGPFAAGQNPDFTCQNSNPAGCQLDPSACTLSGNSISFLNSKSPFTALINGNVYGFFTGITNDGNGLQGGRGPFDNLGGTFITVNCEVRQGADGHQTLAQIIHCTQTNPDNSNITLSDATTWLNWNGNQNGSIQKSQAFYNLPLTAPGTQMTCAWSTQINYTAIGNGPGWSYFGCDVSQGSHVIGNRIWSFLVAMPVDLGGIPAGTHHEYLYAQVENVDFGSLPSANNPFMSVKFENWYQSFKGILVSGSAFSSQYFLPGFNGPVLGFLFGLALIIGGLGIGFAINATAFGTGGGISAYMNRQGTKLMQILGLSLILWSFMYSQFSTWFTSGIFPYGLDGSLGIIGVVISGMFFGGVMWQATQD